MKILKLLIFVCIFSFNLLAQELANDQFLTSTDGYTGDGISHYADSGGWVIINQDRTATKTYNLGIEHANRTVKVDFYYYVSDSWDQSWWGDHDYFYVYANDVLQDTYYPRGNSAYTISMYLQTDNNGDLKLAFKINTDTSDEWAAIDYVSINTTIQKTTNSRVFGIRNPVETRNINGNYQSIGNTVLCYKDGGSTCIDYTGSSRNNDLYLSFIDTDSVANTFNNSSQAQLSIPDNATVVWAALYTQGNIDGLSSSVLEDSVTVTVTENNIATPISVTPKQIDTLSYIYSTYSDIPELLGKKGSDINGLITVANIKAREGRQSGLGYFGAWNLVVIYKDPDLPLKNISVFDGYQQISSSSPKTINIEGFLTPSSGEVVSSLSIFAGEGDKNIDGDQLFLNGDDDAHNISHLDDPADNESYNAFYSNVSSDITRNPNYSNNQGIDIQNYNVGTSGLNLVKLKDTSATIKFTSAGDIYYPSVAIFSTDLYEPRVCYTQTFETLNGTSLSETSVSVGDIIRIRTFISNMKKDATDSNLEDAHKVEITINYDTDNIAYVAGSTQIQNIGENSLTARTDSSGDDIVDLVDANTSKWRVGSDATSTDGGLLEANNISITNSNLVVEVSYEAELVNASDINISNDFLVAYENEQLGIRFDDDSRVNIKECTDFSNSVSVGGALGAFNVVSSSFSGNTNSTDVTSTDNAILTQIAGQAFGIKILSLASDFTTLASYTGNVKLSVITTPSYTGTSSSDQLLCDGATAISTTPDIAFNGVDRISTSFTYPNAAQDLSFRVEYENGDKFVCSRDRFAVRPNKFTIAPPITTPATNMELLTAGSSYSLTLTAEDIAGATTTNYNVPSTSLDTNATKYISWTNNTIDTTSNIPGTLTFSNIPFTVTSGVTNALPISYDDVGKIKLEVTDKTWATVDIDNPGDIAAGLTLDCTGAYICGTIDATYIPDHFTFTAVSVVDGGNGINTYTHLSNDLNSSAKFAYTIEAQNTAGAKTQNFQQNRWEFPVAIALGVSTANTPAIVSSVVASNNLGFGTGSLSVVSTETNASKNIIFNFARVTNTPLNPFVVDGLTDITLTATGTTPAAPISGAIGIITGNSAVIDGSSATFIYGRTHAPRQRIDGNSGNSFIYLEAYCGRLDVTNTCNKTLLPGINYSDNPEWFINPNHTSSANEMGTISQKFASKVAIGASIYNAGDTQVPVSVIASQKLPYKATLENNASSWLIYDRYDTTGNTTSRNNFEIEFSDGSGAWGGSAENNSTTVNTGTSKTNRRTMW